MGLTHTQILANIAKREADKRKKLEDVVNNAHRLQNPVSQSKAPVQNASRIDYKRVNEQLANTKTYIERLRGENAKLKQAPQDISGLLFSVSEKLKSGREDILKEERDAISQEIKKNIDDLVDRAFQNKFYTIVSKAASENEDMIDDKIERIVDSFNAYLAKISIEEAPRLIPESSEELESLIDEAEVALIIAKKSPTKENVKLVADYTKKIENLQEKRQQEFKEVEERDALRRAIREKFADFKSARLKERMELD